MKFLLSESKFFLCLLAFALIGTKNGYAESIDSRIQSVQVFSNQAEVTRIAQVKLDTGSNLVFLDRLPEEILDDSVRVRIQNLAQSKGIKILSIESYLNISDEHQPEEVSLAEEDLKNAEKNLRSLSDQYAALKEEETSLHNIRLGQIPNTDSKRERNLAINTGRWIQTLDFIQTSLADNHKKMETLLDQIDSAREDLNLAMFVVERLKSKSTNQTKTIRIDLESNSANKVDLLVSYRIKKAYWYPIYSAKVFPKGDKADVDFQTYAFLKNETGEDWENVSLSFSAANPASSASLPELQSWFIQSKREPVATAVQKRSDISAPTSSPYRKKAMPKSPAPSIQQSQDFYSSNQSKIQDERAMRKSKVVEKEIQSIKTNIQRRDESIARKDYKEAINYSELTIRSIESVNPKYQKYLIDEKKNSENIKKQALDIQENQVIIKQLVSPLQSSGGFNYQYNARTPETVLSDGAFHKIYLSKLKLNADLFYEVNPVSQTNAYLVGSIQYKEDSPILSGPVAIFQDRDYVGDSLLKNISKKEHFELHLGASQDIVIKRNEEKVREKTGIISNSFTYKNQIKVNVKNARKVPINLIVYDRIPYSTDSRAKVTNIKTSKMAKERNDAFGLFKFDLKLKPNQEDSIVIDYDITHPESVLIEFFPFGGPNW
ncbi:MAG: mucoidy inhibitor MuiA family protein [Leptospira sp.]|nr:mucoidy inhibitor MuiA family protein [Leptospira sp.]